MLYVENLRWVGPWVLLSSLRREGKAEAEAEAALLTEDTCEAPAETHVIFLRRHSAVPPALSLDSLGMKLGLDSGPQNTCREVDQPPGHGPGCG